MPNKKIIEELRVLLKLRGALSKEQLAYAKAEEKAMMQMYPGTMFSDDVRYSNLRTLKRYIGEHALRMMLDAERSNN